MKHTKLTILSAAALLLSAFAADAYGAARHILAAGTDARSRGLAGQTPAADAADTVAFDTSAPILSQGDGKLYHIRKINLHGVKYLNHDILKSSAGLEEGDSIYLPSKFISNAIQRLWAPKYFSDVQIGATIEGDSLDLEVFLKERPRILRWQFDGVGKGKQKDLIEELKLRRNTELSDYVIDKNTRLIKSHFSKKGYRNCQVEVRIDNDTTYEQCVNVTFIIDKNPKVKIGKINFSGNEAFDDKRLRRTFKRPTRRVSTSSRGASSPRRTTKWIRSCCSISAQLARLPQRDYPARFDLRHRLQDYRHRHRCVGGQQILHTRHIVGRQLDLHH